MYCKKCGKFVGGDKDICDECAQASVVQPVAKPSAQPVGLQKPITACILAVIAEILPIIGLSLLELALVSYNIPAIVFGIIFILGSIAPAVVALVLGVRSIKYFNLSESEMPKGKRIASLVLGIAAVANAAVALLCIIIYFFTFIAVLEMYSR